ncbi:MAG: NUDIX domain-containing protein [Treponema sp.]|jgi:8-oxo-dGTP pyrophosphatase MutT (NUDIX family)|nr:NUDIX domain-containing protein [Treponema sp.]
MLFNEIYYRDDKDLLDFNNSKIIFRNAVRAIIRNDNKILMVHLEKTDEYKFPGGGRKEHETVEEAIRREVLEEVGYMVKKVHERIGIITEFAIAQDGENNIFKMDSEYYVAEIDEKPREQHLEEYEEALMFKPCWVAMEKAYRTNKERIEDKHREKTGGIDRETIVLGIIKDTMEL